MNKLSQKVPAWVGKIDEVIVVRRPQMFRSGKIILQEMVTRQNCDRVRWTTEPPVGDDEIGRELDMYHRNADLFAAGHKLCDTTFSIWEVGSDVLLYAEASCEDLLSQSQITIARVPNPLRETTCAMELCYGEAGFDLSILWNYGLEAQRGSVA